MGGLRRLPLAALIAALALTLLVPIYLLDRQDLFETFNLIIFSTCVGMGIAFHPGAWNSLKKPIGEINPAELLIVSVTLGGGALAVIFAGQWVWRAMDKPDWVSDHWFLAWTRGVLMLAIGLAMISAGATQDDQLPVSTYRRLGVFVAIGITVAGILISLGIS